MDYERALILKVVRDRDIAPAMTHRVNDTYFDDPEAAKHWRWITEHYREHGEVPSEEALARNFPSYRTARIDTPDAQTYYITQFFEKRKHGLVTEAVALSREAVAKDSDPDEALAIWSATLRQVTVETTTLRDFNLSQTGKQRWEEYLALRENPGGLVGIPSGFHTVDNATGGFQPEQLVTFIGEPKKGKSTMLLKAAETAHRFGHVPLVMTFEMSAKEQAARYDCMRAHVSHWRLTHGQLRSDEMCRLERYLLRESKNHHDFIMSADASGSSTLTALAVKVSQYQPDIVFVDGVYLMDDEEGEPRGSSQALTNITRGLKRLAQARRIPVIISTQVLSWKVNRRRGLTYDAIGYTSSFAQDSDVIIGVEDSDEDDEQIKRVRVVASRNHPPTSVLVRWDWDEAIFEELPDEDDYFDDDDRPAF